MQVTDLSVAISISTSMDGSLFFHRGLAYYAKGSLGACICVATLSAARAHVQAYSTAFLCTLIAHVSTGDAASDLEAALTKALDESLMASCFYNLGLCKVPWGLGV